MNDFLKIVLGNQSMASFFGNLVLAIIGIVLMMSFDANSRNASSPNTPNDFSIKFLLRDNALRLFGSFALSCLIVSVAIRFCNEMLHVQLNPFIAFVIGLSSDYLSTIIKNLSRSLPSYSTTAEAVDNTVIDTSKPAIVQTPVSDKAQVTATVQADTPAVNDTPAQVQAAPVTPQAQPAPAQPATPAPDPNLAYQAPQQ